MSKTLMGFAVAPAMVVGLAGSASAKIVEVNARTGANAMSVGSSLTQAEVHAGTGFQKMNLVKWQAKKQNLEKKWEENKARLEQQERKEDFFENYMRSAFLIDLEKIYSLR